jgi:hypothetical protein
MFAVTPTSGAAPATLSFETAPQTLTAEVGSNPIQIGISQAQASDTHLTLASSSTGGQFATSPSGQWQSTLPVTINAGATTSPSFYYRDTAAGTPTLTASATGITSAGQTETVKAAAAATITVTPSSATLNAGGKQLFTASGKDAYNNPADLSTATWTTTAPGTVSPASGASTTFAAGTSAGNGAVTATVGQVSGHATMTVTVSPPNAPTNLRASSPTRRHIALSWTGSGTGITYNIYRGTQPSKEGATPIRTRVTGTSFTDSTVTSGIAYYYYVTAVGPGGQSTPSNEASATAR